jgi:hypothetical protein
MHTAQSPAEKRRVLFFHSLKLSLVLTTAPKGRNRRET